MNDLLDAIKDRIKSPLLYSFVISWALVNYRFLMAVFSNESLKVREEKLDESFILFDYFWYGAFWPAILAGLYIFLLPKATLFVNEYVLQREIDQEVMRNRLRNKAPITEDQRARLFAEIEEQKEESKKINQRNAELEATIITLNHKIESFNKALKTETTTQDPDNVPITPELSGLTQKEMDDRILIAMGDIDEKGQVLQHSTLYALYPELQKSEIDVSLDRLEDSSLIEHHTAVTKDSDYFRLTRNGKSYYRALLLRKPKHEDDAAKNQDRLLAHLKTPNELAAERKTKVEPKIDQEQQKLDDFVVVTIGNYQKKAGRFNKTQIKNVFPDIDSDLLEDSFDRLIKKNLLRFNLGLTDEQSTYSLRPNTGFAKYRELTSDRSVDS